MEVLRVATVELLGGLQSQGPWKHKINAVVIVMLCSWPNHMSVYMVLHHGSYRDVEPGRGA